MNSAALFGLLGAVVGGGFTMLGALLSGRQQDRSERNRAARARREQAYSNALRHLLRATNRRGKIDISSGRVVPILTDVESMFDDLVEAQYWVAVVTTVCSAGQQGKLDAARKQMDDFVRGFANGAIRIDVDKKHAGPFGEVEHVYEVVLSSARADLRVPETETPHGDE